MSNVAGMIKPRGRDQDDVRTGLTDFLSTELPAGANPRIGDMSTPESSGMSSETIIFDLAWTEDGTPRRGDFVARMKPDERYPVFPEYDLELQVRSMRLASLHTRAPVPATPWFESTGEVLGTPFFIMEKVDGDIPADVPPYTMGGWLYDATPDEQRELWTSSIENIAELHRLTPEIADLSFLERPQHGETALDQQLGYWRSYYDWALDGLPHMPNVDKAFAWLDANRPHPADRVFNWGDARMGNTIYRNFRPAAILDWEMATLGPPEVDLAWFIAMHSFFADLGERFGIPPIIGFPDDDESVSIYEAASGHTVRDLHWYKVYAMIRFALVLIRTSYRSIDNGEMDAPENPEDMVHALPLLMAMVE